VALIVLDASVVIAHLDPDDDLHRHARAAFEEHSADDLRLPASAYSEALVIPARHGALDAARQRIAALALTIVPVDAPLAERAASIRATHQAVRLPDALVLACGDVLDAQSVLTADQRLRRFDRVRVIGLT
jgi:predicted nucleic acid-binding protein